MLLPRKPGYSQSMSTPSISCRRTNSIALSVKRRRLSAVSAASEKLPDHVQPPTGDQDPQVGMLAPQIREHLEILRIAGEPFDHAAVLDVGEGVVDVRQLVGGDLDGTISSLRGNT